MNLLSQTHRMILQQRLHMFPTSQRTHTPHALHFRHIIQARAIGVAEDCALHVRGFEFPPLHEDFAGRGDQALRNVQAVVLVFGEPEEHGDVCGFGGGEDAGERGGGVGEGVLDVFCCEGWVDGAGPLLSVSI